MTVAAVVASAVFVALLTAAVIGELPALRWRGPRRRRTGQAWLLQAGVRLTPAQFWIGSAVLGIATFALLTVVTTTPAVAVVPSLVVAALPRAVLARERSRRLRAVAAAWPDGLREIVGAVSAGRSLTQALVGLSQNGPEPLRVAFARFPALARTLGVVPALEVIRVELADVTSDRVIEVLTIAYDEGGRIVATVLRDLADTVTADLRAGEELATAALEGKLNARAVFSLPWLLLALITAQPGPFREFYRTPTGILVVGIGALLSLIGIAVVARVSRLPSEPRVLGAERPQ